LLGACAAQVYDIETAHHSPIAAETIERIAALYAVESRIRGEPPDLRREIR
jgi:transposase